MTAPESRVFELLLPEDPDLGLTAPLVFLEPPERGFTAPPDLVRSPEDELPLLLPGRTWRVRSFLLPAPPERPEFQTLVPRLLGSTGLIERLVALPLEGEVPVLRSWTEDPVRLFPLPRTLVVLPEPRLTGTREDLLLELPAR